MFELSRCLSAAFLILAAAVLQAGEAPLVIADFEDGTPKPFAPKNCSVVDEHAAHGAKALKLDGDNKFINAGADTGLPQDWSRYDLVKMEIFNPSDKNLKLCIQIRDSMEKGNYWAWHNRYTALAPGANTIQFAVADLWRGEAEARRLQHRDDHVVDELRDLRRDLRDRLGRFAEQRFTQIEHFAASHASSSSSCKVKAFRPDRCLQPARSSSPAPPQPAYRWPPPGLHGRGT